MPLRVRLFLINRLSIAVKTYINKGRWISQHRLNGLSDHTWASSTDRLTFADNGHHNRGISWGIHVRVHPRSLLVSLVTARLINPIRNIMIQLGSVISCTLPSPCIRPSRSSKLRFPGGGYLRFTDIRIRNSPKDSERYHILFR